MTASVQDWISKVSLAVIPVILAAFATLAWQNAHAITAFSLKLDMYQKEVEHHRVLIEQKMGCK